MILYYGQVNNQRHKIFDEVNKSFLVHYHTTTTIEEYLAREVMHSFWCCKLINWFTLRNVSLHPILLLFLTSLAMIIICITLLVYAN